MNPLFLDQAFQFLKKPHNNKAKIVIIGDVGLDSFVVGSVDRLSPEAPVPVLLVERNFDKPGCAANVAQNVIPFLEAWNLEVSVLGLIGADEAGRSLKELLSDRSPQNRFNCHFVEDRSRKTTQKTRYLAGTQYQLLRVDSETVLPLSNDLCEKIKTQADNVLEGASCVVFQDYGKGVFSHQLFQDLFKLAKSKNIMTIVDPNKNTPAEWYMGADLLKPNILEAEKILGYSLDKGRDDSTVAKAAQQIKEKLQLQSVMITRSGFGLTYLSAGGKVLHYPALARSVYDITGAGDTVVAILAAAYAAGAPVESACVLAMAASSCVVGKVGTAHVELGELTEELEHFRSSFK